MTFSKPLIQWYSQNKRLLPWRLTLNPYNVWLSEIILQQTTVAQGLPYFNKFLTTFPTVNSLAAASEEMVLKQWQGLGYYSRARHLLTTAKYVVSDLNGRFPNTYKDLLKLKGIGPYTAAAIASICFNEPVAVLDGNVFRVLARYFNCYTPINSPQGIKEFKILSQSMLDKDQPADYNQAVMELGALICKPNNPNCTECPISSGCLALKNKSISYLPVKHKKQSVKKRYFNYLVVLSKENATILNKRTHKGIWHNLYEFPLIETDGTVDIFELVKYPNFKNLFGKTNSLDISCFNEKEIVHKLTHQHIYTRFWIIKTSQHPKATIPLSQLKEYPVPILIHNFLDAYVSH
jgi:A/G-specific adenine glycosylase